MPATEVVDLVDSNDAVVGSSTLGECLQRGLLHRAVAVLVQRSGGQVLLQERSNTDLWQPGLWTLSSTGHVKKGESYKSAGERELKEELGLAADLTFVGKYLVPPVTDGKLTEREWVSMFTAKTDSPAIVDRTEVQSVDEVNIHDLPRVAASHQLTEDALFLLSEYLRTTRRES